MAVSTPTISANRSASTTAATVALVLNAIANLMNVGGYLSGAPIPPGILAIEIVLGIGALVAAGGLRGRQRRLRRERERRRRRERGLHDGAAGDDAQAFGQAC